MLKLMRVFWSQAARVLRVQ